MSRLQTVFRISEINSLSLFFNVFKYIIKIHGGLSLDFLLVGCFISEYSSTVALPGRLPVAHARRKLPWHRKTLHKKQLRSARSLFKAHCRFLNAFLLSFSTPTQLNTLKYIFPFPGWPWLGMEKPSEERPLQRFANQKATSFDPSMYNHMIDWIKPTWRERLIESQLMKKLYRKCQFRT